MRYDLKTFSVFTDKINGILTQYRKTGEKPQDLKEFLDKHHRIGIVASPSIDTILNVSNEKRVFQSGILFSLFFILDIIHAFSEVDGIILLSNSDMLPKINSLNGTKKRESKTIYDFIHSEILGESTRIIFDGYNILEKNGYRVDISNNDIHLDNTGYFVCVNHKIVPEPYRFILQFRQMKDLEKLLPFVIAGFSGRLDFTQSHGVSISARLLQSIRATPIKETQNALAMLTLDDVLFAPYTGETPVLLRLDRMNRALNKTNIAISERSSSSIIIDFDNEQQPYADKVLKAMWDYILAMIIWREGLKNVPLSLDLSKTNNDKKALNDIAEIIGIESIIHAVFTNGLSLADIMPEAILNKEKYDIIPSWWFNIMAFEIGKKFKREIEATCPDDLRSFFFPEDVTVQ